MRRVKEIGTIVNIKTRAIKKYKYVRLVFGEIGGHELKTGKKGFLFSCACCYVYELGNILARWPARGIYAQSIRYNTGFRSKISFMKIYFDK